jgi:glycerate kinase
VIVVAPDSFKGTYSAAEVAAAIASGIRAAGGQAVELPLADGGEGTLDVILAARAATVHEAEVRDPLGRPVRAQFALLEPPPGDDGGGPVAIVEAARANGLGLLRPQERDPWVASTYGVGELIVAAARAGARRIMVAVGGSATVDGGAGAIEAIEAAGGPGDVELVVLCDVRTEWERCAEVYGPQKGADEAMVVRLAERLEALAEELPRDPRGVEMTGAAGGLSGGLRAKYGAVLVPGADHVLDTVGFDAALRGADAVVVGEGALDEQTFEGKIAGRAAARARAAGVAVHAIVGRDELGAERAAELGVASVTTAGDEEAMARAGADLVRRLSGAAAAAAGTGE